MAVHASRDDARSRPGARQRHHDVLPGPIDLNDGAEEAFRDNQRQGLWAPGVRRGDVMSAASIKRMKMMDRPRAVADAEAIGSHDRRTDPCFGVAHGGFQFLALGKARGDGGR